MHRNLKKVTSLVSTKWLAERLAVRTTNMTILDGSWHMPAMKRDPFKEFREKHIPGAHFFGIDDCCDKSSQYSHMLPRPEAFSDYVGQLGIDNDTHVIVYDCSDFGIFSAQRVWWTFHVFGHHMVSVLDGGLQKWERDGNEVTSEYTPADRATFHPRYRQSLVRNYDDIQRNFLEKNFLVVDARAAGRFNGTAPEPRPGIPSGHMPGAVNIPFTNLLNPDTNTMKSDEELERVFQAARVDLKKPLVGSCGTGVSACMLALAAHQLGKDDFAVYDGSWTEYVQRAPTNQIIAEKTDT